MGNTTSWSAKVKPGVHRGSKNIVVDLSHFKGNLSYDLHLIAGTFELPFQAGVISFPVGDLVRLARQDVPTVTEVDVRTSVKKKIFDLELIKQEDLQLLQGRGIVNPLMNYDSEWRKLGVYETAIGPVIVETKVVANVQGKLVTEDVQQTWLSKGGSFLVGKAEGLIRVYAKARFQTDRDRRERTLIQFLVGVMIVVPWLMYKVTKRIAF